MGSHSVPNCKNLKITFRASKYPTETPGPVIRKARLEKGLKQKELAKLLAVNEMTVSNWEKDRRRLTAKNLAKVTRFFGELPQI